MVRTPGHVAPSSQEIRAETFSRPVLELALVKMSFLASTEPCAAFGEHPCDGAVVGGIRQFGVLRDRAVGGAAVGGDGHLAVPLVGVVAGVQKHAAVGKFHGLVFVHPVADVGALLPRDAVVIGVDAVGLDPVGAIGLAHVTCSTAGSGGPCVRTVLELDAFAGRSEVGADIAGHRAGLAGAGLGDVGDQPWLAPGEAAVGGLDDS